MKKISGTDSSVIRLGSYIIEGRLLLSNCSRVSVDYLDLIV